RAGLPGLTIVTAMFTDFLRKRLWRALPKPIPRGLSPASLIIEFPLPDFGDATTSFALKHWRNFGFNNPIDFSRKIMENLNADKGLMKVISKVSVDGIGFINFWFKPEYLSAQMDDINKAGSDFGKTKVKREKIMVEYAHPNTHKEMHIGHMRTLITGEALARILEAVGAKIFRANYQGDIGPHVAKSIWGTTKILAERGQTFEQWEMKTASEKAHLLGEGYVRGNQDYESHKAEMDDLNADLYDRAEKVMPVYLRTRKWSLDYYNEFYKRFGTCFDRLFFESEVDGPGKKLVMENIGKVFEKSDGAIIFDGEKHGLHKRVFVTSGGYPTYEGKEMALAFKQRQTFRFDKNIHVVANEQAEYFKVVFKAIESLDPWFRGRECHLSMGMVNLVNQKISSRRGIVITVDSLLDDVKSLVKELTNMAGKTDQEIDDIGNKVTLGAVKYSVLRAHPTLNVEFDLKQSVSLEGSSGPYIQYGYARCKSVLEKAKCKAPAFAKAMAGKQNQKSLNDDELMILRWLVRFPGTIINSAEQMAPNLICGYLFELCQKFNHFYQENRVIGSENESFRLSLTQAVAQVLKNGLWLLGIEAPERM
ncbi:MAG: arginine--tRNA ligase, partial [bacterium]|nr:arginine--tRNA ligase [bacterium]